MAKAKYERNTRGVFTTRVWDGTYDTNGNKRRVNVTSNKSSKDLENKVNALKQSVENGNYVKNTDILFIEYAHEWLKIKKSVREKNTRIMYQNIIDVHLSFLADIKLTDIRNSHFQKAINNALEKPRTCQQIYITFKQILSMAVTDGLIGSIMYDNIIRDINLPKYVKSAKRALNEQEKVAIGKADFTEQEKAFIYIIYYCGLRRGEALALTKFDFNFDTCMVAINKALIFIKNDPEIKNIPKSSNGIRTIPVPQDAHTFLASYISDLKGAQLFTCANGSMITKSAYSKMWDSIINKMNIAVGGRKSFPIITDLTAHIFRHNYCTNLCYQIPNISIKKIAELLGDTEKMVIEVYNHIINEKEDAASVVETALCRQKADIAL